LQKNISYDSEGTRSSAQRVGEPAEVLLGG